MTLVRWFKANRRGRSKSGNYLAVRKNAVNLSVDMAYNVKNTMEQTANRYYDVGFTDDDHLVMKIHKDGQFQVKSMRTRQVALTNNALMEWAKPLTGQDIIMGYDPKEDWYISAYSRGALIGDGKRK